MPPFPHSKGYQEDQARRVLPHALAEGPDTMRALAAQNAYMWPRDGELRLAYSAGGGPPSSAGRWPVLPTGAAAGPAQPSGGGGTTLYDIRVKESVLRNVWLDSITRGALAPFRKAISLSGWPAAIEAAAGQRESSAAPRIDFRGVDGQGRALQPYMMEVAVWQVVDGIHLTLVDIPTVRDEDGRAIERSMGDDSRLGLRPYWIPIQAQHFDPLAVEVGEAGVTLREFAVYLEDVERDFTENPAKSTETESAVWRVYRWDQGPKRPGVWFFDVILEKQGPGASVDEDLTAEGRWQQVLPLGGGSFNRLPIVPFYGDFWSGKAWRARPPYEDEADLQAGLWRKGSYKDDRARRDARMRTHQSGVDVDVDGNPKHQLASDYLYSSEPGGSASVLETSGAALKALREDIEHDERHLREACRSITARRTTGDVTATEAGLIGLEAASYHEAVIRGNVSSLDQLLQLTADAWGLPAAGGSVDWPHDVVSPVGRDALDHAREGVTAGWHSRQGWFELQKTAGEYPEDFDIKQEMQRQRDEGLLTGAPRELDDLVDTGG